MKIQHLIYLGIIVMLLSVSCKKVNNKDMIVIKDCTGSYLRFHGKDYLICNSESVMDFESGTEVKASFKKIDDCPDGDVVTCEMLHINEGWINVTKIAN